MVLTRTDLDEIRKVITTEVRAIVLDQLKAEIIEAISQGIEKKFEKRFTDIHNDLARTKTELSSVKMDNQILRKIIDSNEQYQRNRNVRIFGLKLSENENLTQSVLNVITTKMNMVQINKTDIHKCHRVSAKNPTPDKPPAVLVEFVSVHKRSDVLKHRKLLKNTNISIKEDLTQYRLKVFSAAVSKFSSKNAWCLNGNVYVKSAGVVHRIEDESDVERLEP